MNEEMSLKHLHAKLQYFMSCGLRELIDSAEDRLDFETAMPTDLENWSDDMANSIGELLKLATWGNGAYRAVYDLSPKLLLKLPINVGGFHQCDKEQALRAYLTKHAPHLIRFLCPVGKVKDYLYLTPKCDTDRDVPTLIREAIINYFAKHEIILCDVEEYYQWGWLNGYPVLIDYGDWVFKKDLKTYPTYKLN